MIKLNLTRREITYPLADISNELKNNYFDFVLMIRNVCEGKAREDDCEVEVELDIL